MGKAPIDGLTGLITDKGYVKRLLNKELERAGQSNYKLSIFMVDIDKFKHVNDTYGHFAGDQILKELGQILKEKSREGDIPTRFGGEEFLMILPRTDQQEAFDLAEKIRKSVEGKVFTITDNEGNGRNIKITFSGGIATYPEIKGIDELEKAVDSALYEAKQAGRNRIVKALEPITTL